MALPKPTDSQEQYLAAIHDQLQGIRHALDTLVSQQQAPAVPEGLVSLKEPSSDVPKPPSKRK